jgi:hypothetical protein
MEKEREQAINFDAGTQTTSEETNVPSIPEVPVTEEMTFFSDDVNMEQPPQTDIDVDETDNNEEPSLLRIRDDVFEIKMDDRMQSILNDLEAKTNLVYR